MVQAHVQSEGHLEEDYSRLLESVGASDVRFLIELILEDEKRHHKWLSELAQSVSALVDPAVSPEIPWLQDLDGREQLLSSTKQFLRVERDDARQLRHLLRELRQVEETTLWGLLVRLMLLDTEKHIEILRFIEHRAKGAHADTSPPATASRSTHSD